MPPKYVLNTTADLLGIRTPTSSQGSPAKRSRALLLAPEEEKAIIRFNNSRKYRLEYWMTTEGKELQDAQNFITRKLIEQGAGRIDAIDW